jgi:hypothetical protein
MRIIIYRQLRCFADSMVYQSKNNLSLDRKKERIKSSKSSLIIKVLIVFLMHLFCNFST